MGDDNPHRFLVKGIWILKDPNFVPGYSEMAWYAMKLWGLLFYFVRDMIWYEMNHTKMSYDGYRMTGGSVGNNDDMW